MELFFPCTYSLAAELPLFFFIDKTDLAAYIAKSGDYRCHAKWLTQEEDSCGNRAMAAVNQPDYSGRLADALELHTRAVAAAEYSIRIHIS
jgi:hypothetical protein